MGPLAFGLGVGIGWAAWRQAPPALAVHQSSAAFGVIVLAAVLLAYVAGRGRVRGAVAAAVAAAVAEASAEAGAVAGASSSVTVNVGERLPWVVGHVVGGEVVEDLDQDRQLSAGGEGEGAPDGVRAAPSPLSIVRERPGGVEVNDDLRGWL